MQTNNTLQPILSNKRTIIVDVLRGWAILGVVLMNYISFKGFGTHGPPKDPDLFTTILGNVLRFVFAAKSWTLLSVLFGYGFAVLINNLQLKGLNPIIFFTKRMFWLFVLAFVNCVFFMGDILKDYALMGLVLLFFYHISGKWALRIGILLILISPLVQYLVSFIPSNNEKILNDLVPLFRSSNLLDVITYNLKATFYGEMTSPQYAITVHIVMLACILLGFSAYKYDLFNRLGDYKKQLKQFCLYSFIGAVLFSVLSWATFEHKWAYATFYSPRYITVITVMLFIASSICLLYINGLFKRMFNGMQYMGKMTLTNYMTQNLIAMLVFSGFGLGIDNTMHPSFYIGLALFIYIVQIILSKWWLSHYHYGPIEWIWRQLSYGKRLPIKKAKTEPITNSSLAV